MKSNLISSIVVFLCLSTTQPIFANVIISPKTENRIRLVGDIWYQMSNKSITFHSNRMINLREGEGSSGTLYIKLIASETETLTSAFYELASFKIGVLPSKTMIENVNLSTSYVDPPSRNYYVHAMVVEYPYLDRPISYVSFEKTF